MTARILLRGGLVADAIGGTTRRADVLIDGPVIASITDLDPGPADGVMPPADGARSKPADCEVIDLAPGSVICPGFIDAHVHAEGPLLLAGRVDGALAQGVTTLVVGQDGQSWIGASSATAAYLSLYFAPVNGALASAPEMSIAGYGAAVAGRLTQNVAVLASQGTIRCNVVGLTPDPLGLRERAAARRAVENALSDGAVGLSSGLDYLPSRLGHVDEIADLVGPLAAAGRPYVSHLRGYGPQVGTGLAELVAVGQQAGVRVHASHLWGSPPDLRAAFQLADAAGVAVSYDTYPYRRSSSILAMLLLPPALQADGPARTLAALADPRQRAALLRGAKFSDDFLGNVYLGALPDGDAGYAGQSALAAARTAGQPAGEWVLDLLVRARLNVGAHLDRMTLTDEDLAWLATERRACAGSDGIYQGQHPHPRGYGAFARLAEHYLSGGSGGLGAGHSGAGDSGAGDSGAGDSGAGDSGAGDSGAGYQRLVRHLSANAADAYGLRGRGRLAPGLAADVCVLGPGGLTSRATYDAPREPATGVDLVLVNGVIVWRDGQPQTARFPGQLVS